ncbi:MAG: homospermidine synthase [Rhodospirillales bacterium]|nr:homospermidine synthase [Rhodospirillales bacterium]
MAKAKRHVAFPGRLVMVGFGSIGKGVLPLILRHIDMTPGQITIISAHEGDGRVAAEHNIEFHVKPLTQENYRDILEPRLGHGDFLLNLSVDVSSLALIKLCWERGALYLDTCIEPWAGGYFDTSVPPAMRSNYALRESALALRTSEKRPTAVLTHGANPGLVSHFVKQAMLNIAADTGRNGKRPRTRADWGRLAMDIGIKVIHIAERDTQVASRPKMPGEFVNTWSVDGFISEGSQPAELGWGSHERHWPHDGGRHEFGRGSAIYLKRPGVTTRVRTWTPLEGPFHGFLITHGESISISDYFTVAEKDKVLYRPTVHYAYHPCDDAVLSLHEYAGKNLVRQKEDRILMDEITTGIDELGVLLMGHEKGAYWYGSQLSIGEARELVPHNNATSLQVTAPVLAGMVWAIENPERGITEPDEMDFERVLDICIPYLGPVVGKYSDWTPLEGRGVLFAEDLDKDDPWQFKNIRVL